MISGMRFTGRIFDMCEMTFSPLGAIWDLIQGPSILYRSRSTKLGTTSMSFLMTNELKVSSFKL